MPVEVSAGIGVVPRPLPGLNVREVLRDDGTERHGRSRLRFCLCVLWIVSKHHQSQNRLGSIPGLLRIKVFRRAESDPALLRPEPVLRYPRPLPAGTYPEAEPRQLVVEDDALGLAGREAELGEVGLRETHETWEAPSWEAHGKQHGASQCSFMLPLISGSSRKGKTFQRLRSLMHIHALLEPDPLNQRVVGSRPTAPTITNDDLAVPVCVSSQVHLSGSDVSPPRELQPLRTSPRTQKVQLIRSGRRRKSSCHASGTDRPASSCSLNVHRRSAATGSMECDATSAGMLSAVS